MSRYIIIGAGAVGVSFAAELQRAGRDVLVVARGAQLAALRAGTVRYARPDETRTLRLPAAGLSGPDEVQLAEGDVLLVTVKTQDADAVLADLAWRPVRGTDGSSRPAAAAVPVITVQNGLDAERSALRRFAAVIGGMLMIPAGFVAPGEVAVPSWPAVGIVYLGAYPSGAHPILPEVAEDFTAAGFVTHVVPEIQAVKAAKLAISVTFALGALYPAGPLRDQASALLTAEARDILTASGLSIADLARPGDHSQIKFRPTTGPQYTGNSTAQSLTRSTPVETDFLNGEIVLAARLLGREAPANAAVAERVHRARRDGTPAGSLDDADLLATLPELVTVAESEAASR
jgi:2-dehydropantoate 2-reductase